jgi:hypothetical protein
MTVRICICAHVVEEGILPGGGVAVLRAIKAIERIRTANDDQKHGVEIVRKALSWPARQIAINSGEDGSVVVGKILDKEASSAISYRLTPSDRLHRSRLKMAALLDIHACRRVHPSFQEARRPTPVVPRKLAREVRS